jgi:hypothetical protein
MQFTKKSLHFLYLVAFTYLTMCPSVHQVGDIVRHDVIVKIGLKSQQSNFNNDYTVDPLNFSNKTKAADFNQARSCFDKFAQTSLLALDLSALSTVKLIL